MRQFVTSENLDSREAVAQRVEQLWTDPQIAVIHFFMDGGRLYCRSPWAIFEVDAGPQERKDLSWAWRDDPDLVVIDAEAVATPDIRAIVPAMLMIGIDMVVLDVQGQHADQVAWAHEAERKIVHGTYADYVSLKPDHLMGRAAAGKAAADTAAHIAAREQVAA